MVVANVVSEFQIGNAQIKIADNYCRKTACEVDRILKRIATQAQRQFNAAAAAGKYEQEQDAEIPSDCCNPCGDGSPRVGGGHGDSTGGSGHAERGRNGRGAGSIAACDLRRTAMYKNSEGYPDPTAGMAYNNMQREQRQQQEAERLAVIGRLIPVLKQTAELAGFEVVGRITLRDKETGREYR